MARTSRNGAPSASAQGLDDLDLDDMFADGGDDLFDGLDIDLANMDDITSENNNNNGNAAAAAAAQNSNNNKSEEAPAAPSPESSSAAAAASTTAEDLPKRRKTKRKTTAPTFFDDQSEEFAEEPAKKKKRTSKAASTKKRTSKKAQDETKAAAASTTTATATTATTKKSKAKANMPPPASLKASSSTGTAARQKKAGGGAAARGGTVSRSSTESSTASAPAKAAAPVAAPKAARSQSTAAAPPAPPHPGLNQGTFCGLQPSKTLFYPFLPALPQQVALKNRKIYALLDRVHSSFASQLTSSSKAVNGVQPVKDTEAIFNLMQEAFKDEKSSSENAATPSKADIIGNAIGSMRRTIEFFDKAKLAQDLLAVCALLKRQHDFLKQNASNMESWCKDHFTEDDYAEVYLPGGGNKKRQHDDDEATREPILASLTGMTVRVKVLCTGFKAPKTELKAIIPEKTGPSALDAKKAGTKPLKKKKGTDDAKSVPAASQPTPYAQQRPAKRRKAISDLIARTAQTLEAETAAKLERRRQALAAREKRAKEAAEDPSYQMAHTAGMWKWLEEMGYCQDQVDEMSLQERLEDARSLDWGRLQHVGNTIQPIDPHDSGDEQRPTISAGTTELSACSQTDKLLGLLVDEGSCLDGESDETSEDDDSESHVEKGPLHDDKLADLSGLSHEERSYMHMRSVGLSRVEKEALVSSKGKAHSARDNQAVIVQPTAVAMAAANDDNGGEIQALIDAMKDDLLQVSRLNHQRAEYVQTVSRATLETPKESHQRKLVESSVQSRYAALLKRNKESKAKKGKDKNAKHDDLELPW